MIRIFGSLLVVCFFNLTSVAQSFQYEEGAHYVRLEIPVRTSKPNIIDVTEYFSYGCPHCYRFEPLISQWKDRLPDDVEFNRTPAVWKQATGYELYARTYYTALALDVLEKTHLPLFNAIHSDRRRLLDLESMATFMAEQGVEPVAFIKNFNDSFGIKAMYQQAIARGQLYRSRGVPAVIVNGKYRIEASMVDNSNANMLRVADFLINRERRLIASKNLSAD